MSCVSEALRREAERQKRKGENCAVALRPADSELHLQMWAMLERIAHDIEHPKVEKPNASR